MKAKRLSLGLVFLCTLLGAAAQIFMKAGSSEQPHGGTLQMAMAIFQNGKLFLGYALYGISTVILVYALKYGELSLLYPVIALTYVWVTGLSVLIYHESINGFKMAGLVTVVAGVAVLGRSRRLLTTPLSSMALVLTGSFIGSFGAVFLKSGAEHLELSLLSLITNWRMGIGIAFFLGSSMLYLKGIRVGELTILYPMVSLGYVWTIVWARIFFKEPFTRDKFFGLGMILCGIVLLALGNR